MQRTVFNMLLPGINSLLGAGIWCSLACCCTSRGRSAGWRLAPRTPSCYSNKLWLLLRADVRHIEMILLARTPFPHDSWTVSFRCNFVTLSQRAVKIGRAVLLSFSSHGGTENSVSLRFTLRESDCHIRNTYFNKVVDKGSVSHHYKRSRWVPCERQALNLLCYRYQSSLELFSSPLSLSHAHTPPPRLLINTFIIAVHLLCLTSEDMKGGDSRGSPLSSLP